MKSLEKRTVSIFAGDSPLSGKIGVEIEAEDTPLGICTSSGTVGHSVSYGKADAVVVLSKSASLADAAATAIANLVAVPDDFEKAFRKAEVIEGVSGLLVIKGDKAGAWGNIRLTDTAR